VAEVKPFRAVRYGDRAGPLETLVAPPYDVISPAGRAELAARSRRNVVHLTLPDDEADAGRLWKDWRAEGALADEEPAWWWLSQDYVGPDGVARTRDGLVAALRAEPYERRVILPHERTHRGPKEGRLRLLRETHAQLEPLFFLYEGDPPVARPDREPDLLVEGASLWRLSPDEAIAEAFADRQLLIADGHHRYETTLAYHDEAGSPESALVLAVLVSLVLLLVYYEVSRWLIMLTTMFALAAVGIPAAVVWYRESIAPHMQRRLRRVPGVGSLLDAIGSIPTGLLHDRRVLGRATAFQLMEITLDAATLYVLLIAIGTAAAPTAAFVSFVMAFAVAQLVPVPLGLGTFEASLVGMLRLVGIPLEPAFTATLLLRGFTMWLPMVPGVWFARRELRPRPRRIAA